uniref:Uncharacterized protein n=1 Tax=viral metagenome TaxID=1070528 RepID=A0A6M3LMJ2_9ZZZZ
MEHLDKYLEEIEFEREFDELIECEVETLKFEREKNLLLLEVLFKEVTNQIKNNSPNLNKIRELIIR